ncbi:MAG: mechanosensitive ion channel domain-containing protein [archaeon]
MLYQVPYDPKAVISSLSGDVMRVAFAVVILLAGFIIGKLIERFVLKLLKEFELNRILSDSFNIKINADQIIGSLLAYTMYFFAIVASLEQIGFANSVLYLVALAVMIVVIISFFLAVRDLVPNIIAGIYLYTREKFKDGSHVEIDDIKGTLIHVELLHTKIKTNSGDILFIPNSGVIKSRLKIHRK